MGLSLDEFKDFLDKDLKWRYEPIVDGNKVLTINLHFDNLPSDLSFGCVGRATLIAPTHRQGWFDRGFEYLRAKDGKTGSGIVSQITPKWYPVPEGGWYEPKNYSQNGSGRVVTLDFALPVTADNLFWKPFGDNSFFEWMRGCANDICYSVFAGYNSLERGAVYDSDKDDERLTPRGEIIVRNLDLYFSVKITWIFQEGKESRLIARSWGVPRRYVSKDFF